MPGCKNPGCPAAIRAAVGTIWGVSKLGGRNVKKYLQPRKHGPARSRDSRIEAGSRPHLRWGKADDAGEEKVRALGGTAVARDTASRERFSEITSGSSRGQQGLSTTCKDSSNEAECRRDERAHGEWHMSP